MVDQITHHNEPVKFTQAVPSMGASFVDCIYLTATWTKDTYRLSITGFLWRDIGKLRRLADTRRQLGSRRSEPLIQPFPGRVIA
jgi:hypothetical protein